MPWPSRLRADDGDEERIVIAHCPAAPCDPTTIASGLGALAKVISFLAHAFLRCPELGESPARPQQLSTYGGTSRVQDVRPDRLRAVRRRTSRNGPTLDALLVRGPLQAGLCNDPARVDGLDECLVITLVLVCVGAGEVGDGPVEYIAVAQAGRDGNPVA